MAELAVTSGKIELYLQETGHANRDGRPAIVILYQISEVLVKEYICVKKKRKNA